MSNLSYRIRTEPYSADQQIKINLDQHYDQLNILSLTLKPADTWSNRCSNFGVVVGRVSANKGFGLPNAKVSIFIPLSAEDEYNPEIVARYPYKQISDKRDGIRYNLLPSIKQSPTHTPVGNFPTKEEILRDDLWLEIYQKYYKFTTRTNDSGDFMFYGVPTGSYIIHYDIDLSDIGDASVVPFELIAQGQPEQKFDGPYKFKSSPDIDSLAQIVTLDKTINVQPFWGSKEMCSVQITRSDFDLTDKGIELKSYALFIGSSVTDSENNLINQRCKVKKHVGEQAQLQSMPGSIEILTVVDSDGDNVPDSIEFLDLPTAKIDENGAWAFLIELNGQKVIKDEFGNEMVSPSSGQGVTKNGYFRFKMSIGVDTEEEVRYRAKYIVPNNGAHEYAYLFNRLDVEYTMANGTTNTIPGFNSLGDIGNHGTDSQGYYTCGPLFREFTRKKIYTVRNYIPRYIKNTFLVVPDSTPRFLGFKEVDFQKAKAPIPYNRMNPTTGILYDLVCLLYTALFNVLAAINWILWAINGIIDLLNYIVGTIVQGIMTVVCAIVSAVVSLVNWVRNILLSICNFHFHIFNRTITLWDFCGQIGGSSGLSTPSWCPPDDNYEIPRIPYISFECCTSCEEGKNCNCYVPFYDCYTNDELCDTAPNNIGVRPLRRCPQNQTDGNGSMFGCNYICQQQAENSLGGGAISNDTKVNCKNGYPHSCSQMVSKGIGDDTYEEFVYSLCIDSLKQCMLAQYVCDSEELVLEFYNAWMAGVLYFPQIRYKERVNSDGYLKKAKFCDADWKSAVPIPVPFAPYVLYAYPDTHPFKNDEYDTVIAERELFQPPAYPTNHIDVNAGLVKYWPRQPIPPLGYDLWTTSNSKNDYIKGPFDDIYYNARQLKRSEGYNRNPDSSDINNSNVLLATEVLSLGSYLIVDDPDDAPFFISQVPETTYKRPEDLVDYFCFSCSQIVPNNGATGTHLHEKICEFGTDFNDESDYVDTGGGALSLYSLYIDQSLLSGRTHILLANTVNDINDNQWSLRYGHQILYGDLWTNNYLLGREAYEENAANEADYIYVNQYIPTVNYETTFYYNPTNNTTVPTVPNDPKDAFVRYEGNPYYMYYGLHPGKTAINLVQANFIPKNICNI